MNGFLKAWVWLCLVLTMATISLDFAYALNRPTFPTSEANLEALEKRLSSDEPTTIIPFDPRLYPGVKLGIIAGQGSLGIVATIRGILNTAKSLLAPVLVFLIAGFGIQLIIAGGNEEKFSSAANHFFYILVGTAFVIFSDFLSQTFFLYQAQGGAESSFLSSNEQIAAAAQRLTDQIRLLVIFLRYVLGGIAVFYVVKSGSIILFNADEETVQKQKDVFIYGFAGLILIMVSEALVNVVFNVKTLPDLSLGELFAVPQVDVGGGITLLTNVTNLLLAIMGGLFLFTLVSGGVLYALSAGNEERGQKASKLIIGSLIGLVIAFSSYTLVAEFSSGGRDIKVAPTETIRLFQPTGPQPAPASSP